MVSFQCDGLCIFKPFCRAKCCASFTCVDCSKTFRTPAEWKVHTSCISEAEKYQKGLYKGKKTQNGSSGPRSDKPQKSLNETTSKSFAGETGSASGNGVEDNLPSQSGVAVEGTSATPEGEADAADAVQTTKTKKEKKKKRKATEVQDAPKDDAPASTDSKTKKKKRKVDHADREGKSKPDRTGERDATENTVPSLQMTTAPAESEHKKSKEKKRKEKSKEHLMKDGEEGLASAPIQAEPVPSSAVLTKRCEEAHNDEDHDSDVTKKGSYNPSAESRIDAMDETPAGKKKGKRPKKREGDTVPSIGNEDTVSGRGKSDKKRKRSDNKGVADEVRITSQSGRKKEKKEKRRKDGSVDGKADTS